MGSDDHSTSDAFDGLVASFQRSLRARNRSPRTIRSYVSTADAFAQFLAATEGTAVPLEAVERRHVEEYIEDQLARHSASTAASRYRYLQQFLRWAVDEGEIEASPMANMAPPTVEEKPVPVLPKGDLRALVNACEGREFDDRRDMAMIRLFIDTGIRRAEMAGLTLEGVDLDAGVALVHGKGNRSRHVPFGTRTTEALDRYVRVRRKHRHHDKPALWLGIRGPMTDSGVAQVVRRRAHAAGLGSINPHQFRHTFSHMWLAAGGAEGDLQAIAGWKSPQMLARYGASARSERAIGAHHRLGLGDQL